MKNKTEFKPNYAVHPSETVMEMCFRRYLGESLSQEIERGITDKNAYLLEALFGIPRQFFLNLQKNYDEITRKQLPEQEVG